MTYNEILEWSRDKIRETIGDWDIKEWENELKKWGTLAIFKIWKKKVKYDEFYDNSRGTKILEQARTNSMKLEEWYNRGKSGNIEVAGCMICREELENIKQLVETILFC